MAKKKTSPARASASRSRRALKTLPNEIAVRYRTGQARKVREALSPFGSVDSYPSQRMMVLQRSRGVRGAEVESAIDDLQRSKLVEFVTPVLVDPKSRARQVLTDEIVLRLKPGRTRQTLSALTAEHGIEVCKQNEFDPSQYIVKVPKPSGTQTLDVARSLDKSSDVEFASPNFLTESKR